MADPNPVEQSDSQTPPIIEAPSSPPLTQSITIPAELAHLMGEPPFTPEAVPVTPTPEPPQINPEVESVKPKRVITTPRRFNDVTEIDAVLEACSGNRTQASEQLGISRDQLKCRIHDEPLLRNKWNRNAMKERARIAIGLPGQPLPPPETNPALRLLMEAARDLIKRRNDLWIQIDRVKKRMDQGDEAEFSDDPEVRKKSFKVTVTGFPAQERLLRENHLALMAMDVKIQSEFRKTVDMVNKITGEEGAKNASSNGPKRAKSGMPPKSAIVELQRMSGGMQ